MSSCASGLFSDERKGRRSRSRPGCLRSRSSSVSNVPWRNRCSLPKLPKSKATVMGRSSKHDLLPVLATRLQATAHGRRVRLDRDTPAWNPGTSYRRIASLSALRSPRAWSRDVLSSMNFVVANALPGTLRRRSVKTAFLHTRMMFIVVLIAISVSSTRCTFFSEYRLDPRLPTRCPSLFSPSPFLPFHRLPCHRPLVSIYYSPHFSTSHSTLPSFDT